MSCLANLLSSQLSQQCYEWSTSSWVLLESSVSWVLSIACVGSWEEAVLCSSVDWRPVWPWISVCKASIKPSISIWTRFVHALKLKMKTISLKHWNSKWTWNWNVWTHSVLQFQTCFFMCFCATVVSSNSSAPWCWGTASHHPEHSFWRTNSTLFRANGLSVNRYFISFHIISYYLGIPHVVRNGMPMKYLFTPWQQNCSQIDHSWPCAPGCRKAPRLSTALPPPCRIGSRPCKRAPQAILPVAHRKSFSNGVQLCTMYCELVSELELLQKQNTLSASLGADKEKQRDFVGTQELNGTHAFSPRPGLIHFIGFQQWGKAFLISENSGERLVNFGGPW